MNYKKAIDHILDRLQHELPDNLRYHSLGHTLGVLQSSRYLADKEGITPDELKILATAAAYHDSGFIHTYKNHEEEGCRIVSDTLPEFGFSQDQIERINRMIMATKIPQNPETHLGKILCDADLDYLGGDSYGEISRSLYDELGLNGVEMSQDEWRDVQIRFLESHHYWTEFGVRVLTPRKREVLEKLKRGKVT